MNKIIKVLPIAFAMGWTISACSLDDKSAGVTEETSGVNMMASGKLLSWDGAARQYKADVGGEKANGSWFFDAYNAEGAVAGTSMPSEYTLLNDDILTSALDSCKGICFSYKLKAVDIPEDDEDFEYPYVAAGIALPKLVVPKASLLKYPADSLGNLLADSPVDSLAELKMNLYPKIKVTSSAGKLKINIDVKLDEEIATFKSDFKDNGELDCEKEKCLLSVGKNKLKPFYESPKIIIYVQADKETMQGKDSVTGTVNIERLEWEIERYDESSEKWEEY